jgi:cyclase
MNRFAMIALAVSTIAFGGAACAQGIDFSKVEIKIIDLGRNTYRLEGQGGNITIAVGTDGIIMVDGQFAPLHNKIKAAIAAISPLPIKYLVNTHFHGDHTGGNAGFQNEGATVVAEDNVRVRLAAGTVNGLTGIKTPPVAPEALPKQTYIGGSITLEEVAEKLCLHMSTTHTLMAIPGFTFRMPTCSALAIR